MVDRGSICTTLKKFGLIKTTYMDGLMYNWVKWQNQKFKESLSDLKFFDFWCFFQIFSHNTNPLHSLVNDQWTTSQFWPDRLIAGILIYNLVHLTHFRLKCHLTQSPRNHWYSRIGMNIVFLLRCCLYTSIVVD